MNNKIEKIRRILMVVLGAALLVACGGLETDVPAMSPPADEREGAVEGGQEGAEDDGHGEEDPNETSQDEVDEENLNAHMLPVVGEQPGDGESGEVDYRCERVCFKLSWCGAQGPDIGECIEGCQAARYNGMVSEPVFECLEDANTCIQVSQCEDQIEPCYEVCGVNEMCGYSDDHYQCQHWCSTEIWEGRLDWSAQGCVGAAGRNFSCEDLTSCGLSEPTY